MSSTLIRDEDGKPNCFITQILDITERKQAEEELRTSEAKYRHLYQSMMDAFVGVDMDGFIKEYNDAYRQMLGYEPEELLKLRYIDVTPEKWHSCEAEILHKQILQRGYSDIYEKEYRRKDGTVFPIELRVILLKDDHDRPYGMWAIVRDITERKRAEEALKKNSDDRLRQSHDELQTIYEGIIEGLVITDIETRRFVRVNSSICQMLGYSEQEMLSRSVKDIHPLEKVPDTLQKFQATADSRISIAEDCPILKKDGTVFYADITGHRVFYGGRPCILALFRDITERKQAQEALQRQHHTLKHLLQASDHERQLIAYEIHDELAQQLTGAIMQFQTYESLKDNKPRMAAKAFKAGMMLLQQGHNETRRLIAGVRPPVLDEFGVAEAIAHLVNEQNRHKAASVEYRSSVSFDRLAPTLENSIYRIAQEGLTNACQHSQSKKVRISLSQQEDWVRIEIRDWGVGFDPTAVSGKGFGLQGIQERARLLGGKCKISSSPGKGTRIAVDLPVVLREAEE